MVLSFTEKKNTWKITNIFVVYFLPSIHFWVILHRFSRKLSSANDNCKDILQGLNFANGSFFNISRALYSTEKAKMCKIREILSPNINPLKLDIILEKYLCGQLLLAFFWCTVLQKKIRHRYIQPAKLLIGKHFFRNMPKLQLHFPFKTTIKHKRLSFKYQTSNISYSLFLLSTYLINY